MESKQFILISIDRCGCSFIDPLNFSSTLFDHVFHKAAGNVFSHSSPLMLVKPFYAIDISHWVVRLEIDAQQKDCKVERTLFTSAALCLLAVLSCAPQSHRSLNKALNGP